MIMTIGKAMIMLPIIANLKVKQHISEEYNVEITVHKNSRPIKTETFKLYSKEKRSS